MATKGEVILNLCAGRTGRWPSEPVCTGNDVIGG
jgi:hypothetical protein